MNEAELLFSHVLKCDRLSLYLNKAVFLDKKQGEFVSSVLKKRILGYPLQYILGKADFFGEEFLVDESVLIPRPETEILVDYLIKKSLNLSQPDILDIGTGSGCIAISLAKGIEGSHVVASDKSGEALKTAKKNSDKLKAKVEFIQSDLFEKLHNRKFDLIVTNPPYIPTQEISNLQPEISFEPAMALDGGIDGLDFYRKIAVRVGGNLNKQGILAMEIGFGQLERVEKILQNQAKLKIIDIIRDYSDIERFIIARKGS